MAHNIQPRRRWFDGLPVWSSRLMVALFVVGALIVAIDLTMDALANIRSPTDLDQSVIINSLPVCLPVVAI